MAEDREPLQRPGAHLNVALLRALGKQRPCHACGAHLTKYMSCSRCKSAYYCSKECQVQDWKAHKTKCKRLAEMRQEARDEAGDEMDKMRQKWLKRVGTLLPLIVFLSFSEEDFNAQPPQHEFAIAVKFHFNYGTFFPLMAPALSSMDRWKNHPSVLRDIQSNYEEYKKQSSSKERTHFIRIVFKDHVESLICNVDPEKASRSCRDLGLSTAEYCHTDFCKLFQEINLPTSLYDVLSESNKRMMEANLSKQFIYFQSQTDFVGQELWSRFVLNAFRTNERKSLKTTHALFVYFTFDFELGKMKQITRHELMSLSAAKERVPAQIRRQYLCLDDPDMIPVILVEEFGRDLFALSHGVGSLPKGFKYWPEEQSLKTREFYFEQLQKLKFPVDNLQFPTASVLLL